MPSQQGGASSLVLRPHQLTGDRTGTWSISVVPMQSERRAKRVPLAAGVPAAAGGANNVCQASSARSSGVVPCLRAASRSGPSTLEGSVMVVISTSCAICSTCGWYRARHTDCTQGCRTTCRTDARAVGQGDTSRAAGRPRPSNVPRVGTLSRSSLVKELHTGDAP